MLTKKLRVYQGAAMWAASLFLLVSCESSLAPYVHHVNPNTRTGWQSETTFTSVEVCYNRLTTTPEAVRHLAEDVCIKEGEGAQAVFADDRKLQCSLSRPVSAIFLCR